MSSPSAEAIKSRAPVYRTLEVMKTVRRAVEKHRGPGESRSDFERLINSPNGYQAVRFDARKVLW